MVFKHKTNANLKLCNYVNIIIKVFRDMYKKYYTIRLTRFGPFVCFGYVYKTTVFP